MATNSKDNTDNQSQLLNTTSNSLEEKINPMNSKQHQSIMKRKEFKEISSKTPKKKVSTTLIRVQTLITSLSCVRFEDECTNLLS